MVLLAILKDNYDGYHFSGNCPNIYNPFSLLNALNLKKIDNYWVESGIPKVFLDTSLNVDLHHPNVKYGEIMEGFLTSLDSYMQLPESLLYEAGFLTIKDYDDEAMIYSLAIPNKAITKTIIGIAANYSLKTNNIDSWLIM